MDGLNRTCTFCDKTFSTITNLNKHKRNVHKEGLDITSKKVRNKRFICPKCEYETFSTFNILLKHLKERHDFVSNFEEKTFVSEDEFDLWRFQVENETGCEFVQHNSAVVLADVTKKKYLHCNQSFRLSKSILKNCKRTFESQGSSITQKTCPARIEVEVQKNKNNVTVYARFWKTHLGHEPDIGHYGRVKKHCRHKKISTLRLALIQMAVGEDKGENIRRAIKLVNNAISEGSSLIVLPECFNCPYGTKYFPKYAEEIPGGETSKSLSEVAKQNRLFLVGGSIPEREGDKLYNTSTVWGPEGQLLCKHRKIHLFDIDIPGGITFKESDTLAPGSNLSIFNINNLKVGLGICYDLRFSELSRLYRKKGVDIILYPAAFNMTTGPLHWELLLRARAVDEQVFVAAVSPAQDSSADYVAWGHSMVVNPWGCILKQAKFEEELIVTDLDLQEIKKVRQQIPVFKQKRQDLYDTVDVKSKM